MTVICRLNILINFLEIRIEVSDSKQRNLQQNWTVRLAAALIIHELELQDLDIARETLYVEWRFSHFREFLQANAGTILRIRSRPAPPTPSQLHYLQPEACRCAFPLNVRWRLKSNINLGRFNYIKEWYPILVAARSMEWVCGRSLAGIMGSDPAGGMDICCECCVLSGRGLWVGLITYLEESYRLWCVVVCDLET